MEFFMTMALALWFLYEPLIYLVTNYVVVFSSSIQLTHDMVVCLGCTLLIITISNISLPSINSEHHTLVK